MQNTQLRYIEPIGNFATLQHYPNTNYRDPFTMRISGVPHHPGAVPIGSHSWMRKTPVVRACVMDWARSATGKPIVARYYTHWLGQLLCAQLKVAIEKKAITQEQATAIRLDAEAIYGDSLTNLYTSRAYQDNIARALYSVTGKAKHHKTAVWLED